jgi:hypothetical protein
VENHLAALARVIESPTTARIWWTGHRKTFTNIIQN